MTRCRRLAVSVLAATFAFAPPALPAQEEAPAIRREVIELGFLDPNDAGSILRAQFDMRRISVVHQNQSIVVTDSPDRVAAARELLERLDVPPARWQCAILAGGGGEQTVLREFETLRDKVALVYGQPQGDHGWIQAQFDVSGSRAGQIRFHYEVQVRLPSSQGSPLEIQEAVPETILEGDEVALVTTRRPDHSRALGNLLGVSHSVETLVVRLETAR